MISNSELKILVIEKENIDLYFDFKKLVKSSLEHPKYLVDYNKNETINILNNKGYIILYKYQNIIVSGILMKKYKYKNMSGYLLGPILIFEDVKNKDICKYMINSINSLIKDLGFNYSFIICHRNDLFLEESIKLLDYQFLDLIKHRNIKFNIYYKDIV